MKSEIRNPKFKIVIVGAGPAGASAAIRLADNGFPVTLVERERFPRHKLCGEFISPECLLHFQSLGVLEAMNEAGAERITETVFYEPGGKSVVVPSAWFQHGGAGALGLSRAEMDFRLLQRARAVGVEVFEETQAVGLLMEKENVRGVKARGRGGENFEIPADLTVDATGRARVLGKLAGKESQRAEHAMMAAGKREIRHPKSAIESRRKQRGEDRKPKLIGFKAHLRNSKIGANVCEIYSFRGGYGGLSRVENGLANHCFLIKAEIVKEFGGDAERIVREVVFQNRRAAEMLRDGRAEDGWLAVAVDGFGAKNLNPLKNLLTIGDAGAFIDPFTGSGMLMALESGEILAAAVISENCAATAEKIAVVYQARHAEKFRRRLFVCSLVRRAAFAPRLTKTLISALSLSERARAALARATRRGNSAAEKGENYL